MMSGTAGLMRVPEGAVGAALGLEGHLGRAKVRSEATQHILDHMVGPNTQSLIANIGRQMPISQMPGEPHQLSRVFMPDFNDELGRGLNLKPSTILELQTVPIRHRDRLRKVK